MDIWSDFTIDLQVEDILRGQGLRPESPRFKHPRLAMAAAEAVRLGSNRIAPQAAIQSLAVLEHRHQSLLLEGDIRLAGKLVADHLTGAERITAVVCTIGPHVERLCASLMESDPVTALALDGLGNAAIESLGQQVCGRLAESYRKIGLETSSPLSPGELDWPVDVGQAQIFSLLEPGPAGVRLTDASMMIPQKTVSFVVGAGKSMQPTDLCELCSMRERCRYRRI